MKSTKLFGVITLIIISFLGISGCTNQTEFSDVETAVSTESVSETTKETSSEISHSSQESSQAVITQNTDVKLLITDYSSQVLQLEIENGGNQPYGYGNDYRIEVIENGEWSVVSPIKEVYYEDMLYRLAPGEKKILFYKIGLIYGELKNGQYRIVKEIKYFDDTDNIVIGKTSYISAEFEV